MIDLTERAILEDMAYAVQSALAIGDTELAMLIHSALMTRLGMH